jgi:hypothetical protein
MRSRFMALRAGSLRNETRPDRANENRCNE